MEFKTITDLNITEDEYITVRKESDVITGYELISGLTVYDFNGLTFDKDLYINGTSITVKNATISGQLVISSGCIHCKFKNVVFERDKFLQTEEGDPLPLVSFGSSTVSTIFEDCTFIGYDDTKDFVMRASEYREYTYNGENLIVTDTSSVNNTLVMKNCRFKNLACAVWATKVSNCVIEGGWFEDVKCIVHNDGSYNEHNIAELVENYNIPNEKISSITNCSGINANVVINGIVIDNVDYIFRSRKTDDPTTILYDFDNIVINGILGEVNIAVVDFSGGNVNLEYNAPVSSKKLFSDSSPSSYHCNVKKLGGMDYKSTGSSMNYTFVFDLQPKETICPFKMFKFYSAGWSVDNIVDDDIKVYLQYIRKLNNEEATGIMGFYDIVNINNPEDVQSDPYKGIINSNGNLIISNNSEVAKTVEMTITAYSVILPA